MFRAFKVLSVQQTCGCDRHLQTIFEVFGVIALAMTALLAVVALLVPDPLRMLDAPRALLLLGGSLL